MKPSSHLHYVNIWKEKNHIVGQKFTQHFYLRKKLKNKTEIYTGAFQKGTIINVDTKAKSIKVKYVDRKCKNSISGDTWSEGIDNGTILDD